MEIWNHTITEHTTTGHTITEHTITEHAKKISEGKKPLNRACNRWKNQFCKDLDLPLTKLKRMAMEKCVRKIYATL